MAPICALLGSNSLINIVLDYVSLGSWKCRDNALRVGCDLVGDVFIKVVCQPAPVYRIVITLGMFCQIWEQVFGNPLQQRFHRIWKEIPPANIHASLLIEMLELISCCD